MHAAGDFGDGAAATRRVGARLSITARSNPQVNKVIASTSDDAWTPIHDPHAV
jgi:hypothetical protein